VNERRTATLRATVEAFAPPDARAARVTELAAAALDGLSPERGARLRLFLDLLAAPMRLPLPARRAALRALADAPALDLRSGYAALKRLILFLVYAESEPGSENPTWARLGYPGPRDDTARADVPLALSDARDGETVDADVVVVGSGAGGGTAAGVFARAGARVVVLEAGGAYDATTFDQRERSIGDLYLERGLSATKDLGISIFAGATLGGGTAINWCTSFRLPERIAAEWEKHSGISGLNAELCAHYGALERELELAPARAHNRNNAAIAAGCAALGLHAGAMPRNAPPDCGAGCGYCGMGCAYAKKRSTARVYLPQVVAAGGAVYARARAERILTAGTRATGVAATQTGPDGLPRRFTVRAKLVVCAAGTLRTPGLLARSGIAAPLLGRRLFLHPVSGCMATFDAPVEAWSGPMQSAYSDAYNYRVGNYGAKIEAAPTHPGVAALALPWESARAHERLMSGVRHGASLIAVTRDRDPGALSLDDEATIDYRVSPFDAENLLNGLVGLADVAFGAGATRVTTWHNRPIVLERAAWNGRARADFIHRLMRIGAAPCRQIFFSAHQMGTAAMGAERARSVVDPAGRVWGFDNLLVADGSIFPQSSGVNPMLTIMAMARRVAAQHADRVTSGASGSPSPSSR
jgi:choline dehydrogenase-like flavoprotein